MFMIRHALWLAAFDFVAGFLVPILVRVGVFRVLLIVIVAVGSALLHHFWPLIQSIHAAPPAQSWTSSFLPTDILIASIATALGVGIAAWIQHRGRAGEI